MTHAVAEGLAQERFEPCFDNPASRSAVERDVIEGRKAGVRGTPTLFVGFPVANEVKIEDIVRGNRGLDAVRRAIDAVLDRAR